MNRTWAKLRTSINLIEKSRLKFMNRKINKIRKVLKGVKNNWMENLKKKAFKTKISLTKPNRLHQAVNIVSMKISQWKTVSMIKRGRMQGLEKVDIIANRIQLIMTWMIRILPQISRAVMRTMKIRVSEQTKVIKAPWTRVLSIIRSNVFTILLTIAPLPHLLSCCVWFCALCGCSMRVLR